MYNMDKLLTCIAFIFYRAMLCVNSEFIEPSSSVLNTSVGNQTRVPCRFSTQAGQQVARVTWFRQKPKGIREQIITGHFTEGPLVSPDFVNRVQFESLNFTLDSTLLILDTEKFDQATYTCHISTIPSGNFERQIDVDVWILPSSYLEPVILQEGQPFQLVASCVSVGDPPPHISWDTDLPGKTQNRTGEDGSVISRFFLHPLRFWNGHRLDCLVWHPSFDKPERHRNDLIVHYPPDAKIHFFGSWWFEKKGAELQCVVTGNPQPHNITWSRRGGNLPDRVIVDGDKLLFSGPLTRTDEGVYVCQAANSVGSIEAEFLLKIPYVCVLPEPRDFQFVIETSAAGTLVIVIVIVIVMVIVMVLCCRQKNRKPKRVLSERKIETNISGHASMRRFDSVTTDIMIQAEEQSSNHTAGDSVLSMEDQSILGDQRIRQDEFDSLDHPALYTSYEQERASKKELREMEEEKKERINRVLWIQAFIKRAVLQFMSSGQAADDKNPMRRETEFQKERKNLPF